MNEDTRDERLTGLLDAAVRGIEPVPGGRLPEVLRRGGRRRAVRWTAIGTALAVFVGGVAWGAVTVGHGGVEPIDLASWSRYRDPQGWSARYPAGWYRQTFAKDIGHVATQGALFSNVQHRFQHPDLGAHTFTTAWDLSGLGDQAVVVEIERFSGGPARPTQPDTQMPLSLRDATRLNDSPTPGPPVHLQIPFVNGDRTFVVNVWFGATASQRDREIAALIVRSITFGPDTTDWAKAGSLDTTGWTFAYPPDWSIQDLPACDNAPVRTGVLVATPDVRVSVVHGPPNCEAIPPFKAFPPSGVAMAVSPVGPRFGLAFPELNTPLPISWDQLLPDGRTGNARASYLGITVKRNLILAVRTWVGPNAPSSAIEDLKAVVASLGVKDATHWTTYENSDGGFSVTYPDDWFRAGNSLTRVLASPTEILSLGTYELRPGGKACFDAYLPGKALAALGQADVFITVQKTSPEGMPPRPTTIGPDAATITLAGLPACDSYKTLQLRGWWIPFEDQGHGFYVFVAAGPFAANDQQTMRMVWHVVNSLRFTE